MAERSRRSSGPLEGGDLPFEVPDLLLTAPQGGSSMACTGAAPQPPSGFGRVVEEAHAARRCHCFNCGRCERHRTEGRQHAAALARSRDESARRRVKRRGRNHGMDSRGQGCREQMTRTAASGWAQRGSPTGNLGHGEASAVTARAGHVCRTLKCFQAEARDSDASAGHAPRALPSARSTRSAPCLRLCRAPPRLAAGELI